MATYIYVIDTLCLVGFKSEIGGGGTQTPNFDGSAQSVRVGEISSKRAEVLIYLSKQADAKVLVSFGLIARLIT